MDNNIVETVYKTLENHTEAIGKTIAERNALEEEKKAGRYSQKALESEINPKIDALRGKIHSMCEEAISEAQGHINQYKTDADALNNLNPAELTDDIKLLQSGIVLKAGDIQGILKRNEGNRTMTQIILRYAEEHGIDTGNTLYVGGQQEQQTARNLEGILYYYKNWIDKPNAKEMLNTFFNL